LAVQTFYRGPRGSGYDALYQTTQGLIGKGYQTPGLGGLFSTFTVNVPQLDADIDRVKAKQQGVPLENLFETMQVYLGSLYVNDFNRSAARIKLSLRQTPSSANGPRISPG